MSSDNTEHIARVSKGKDRPVDFHADGNTVHDFDERFRLEDEGFIRPEDRFWWSMIEDGGVDYRLDGF